MHFPAGLYIVATPIGNIKDITLRAIEVLQKSDYILCEDSRVAHKLLAKYAIKAKLMLYNDHSDNTIRAKVADLIANSNIVSMISDAGTPLISDPGYKLVRYLQDIGVMIDFLPGACAPIAALCLSGMASDRFAFMGFVPKSTNEKIALFQESNKMNLTTIFFDTAPRLLDSLSIALQTMGNKNAAIVREITKMHQEIIKGDLQTLVNILTHRTLKGEIVFLIERAEIIPIEDMQILEKLNILRSEGFSIRDCVKILSLLFNNNKTHIYNIAKNL